MLFPTPMDLIQLQSAQTRDKIEEDFNGKDKRWLAIMFGLAGSVWLNTKYRGTMMLQYHVGRIQWKVSNWRQHVEFLQITVGLFGWQCVVGYSISILWD